MKVRLQNKYKIFFKNKKFIGAGADEKQPGSATLDMSRFHSCSIFLKKSFWHVLSIMIKAVLGIRIRMDRNFCLDPDPELLYSSGSSKK